MGCSIETLATLTLFVPAKHDQATAAEEPRTLRDAPSSLVRISSLIHARACSNSRALVSAFFARSSAADNLASADAIRDSARFSAFSAACVRLSARRSFSIAFLQRVWARTSV